MTDSAIEQRVPVGRLPMDPPSRPARRLPALACDAHLHLFGEPARYPLAADLYERPAHGTLDDWLGRLTRQMSTLGLQRAVAVGSVAYREDNRLLLDALARNPDRLRGIALVSPGISRAALAELSRSGVAGVRVNLRHPGALDFDGLKGLSAHLGDLGMHAQILLDSQEQFDAVHTGFRAMGLPVVVDHMASFDPTAPAFFSKRFLQALEDGWLYVKLSAPFRIEAAPYPACRRALDQLLAVRPDRLMWGTDWPFVIHDGPNPDAGQLADWVMEACSEEQAEMVFSSTAGQLYGFPG